MKYLDLFSGIGGFALGAYNAGWRFDEHYFSEVDKYAKKVYRQRFPDAIPLGDIKKINTKTLANGNKRIGHKQADEIRAGRDPADNGDWFITGGFPCQDISFAGKAAGIFGRKSSLWFEMWRIIRSLRPRVVIIENVGAITIRGLDTLLSSLAAIRYDAEWQDIRAVDMGAPHRRERIWIVAYPVNGGPQDRWPEGFEKAFHERDENLRPETEELCRSRWPAEPAVGRVAHGIPKRVDRLKCLGNSIVPQIAELLFRQIGVSAEGK